MLSVFVQPLFALATQKMIGNLLGILEHGVIVEC
jgi:hypothetical protein